MPVLAVKSLPSSTSAFAGSQAAQHRVSDFACAPPVGAAARRPAATALANMVDDFMFLPSPVARGACSLARRPDDHPVESRTKTLPPPASDSWVRMAGSCLVKCLSLNIASFFFDEP